MFADKQQGSKNRLQSTLSCLLNAFGRFMFTAIEKYKNPARFILILVSLGFVGFGFTSVSWSDGDYLTKVGDTEITTNQVNQALQDAQAAGNAAATQQTVLASLLQKALLTEGAKNMGIGVSLEQLKQVIVNDPAFHDDSGKFSQAKFNEFLGVRHLTEDSFVEDVRSRYALQNLLGMAESGALVSDAQARQLINLMQAERTVRTVTLNPQAFAAQVKVNDDALKSYYNTHKDRFTLPEAVKFQYVALSLNDLAAKQTVSESELKQAFDQQAQQAQPGREVAHILIAVPQGADAAVKAQAKAQAEKVLTEAKANPKNFAALAQKYSQDSESSAKGGNLGVINHNGSFPKAFEDKAFSLQPNEIGLAETEFGYHIIQVASVQGKPTFEQAKTELETQLKQKKAQQEFSRLKEQLADEAVNNPDNLDDIAKKMGLKLGVEDNWVSKQEAQNSGMPQDLINALFSQDLMKNKYNSDPISVTPDTVWVVRDTAVRAKTQQAFESVKAQVQAAYIEQQSRKLAEESAKQDLAALQKGQAVALAWSQPSVLTTEQARQSMPPEAYHAMVKAKPVNGKPAYALLTGLPAPVLIEVQSIKAPANSNELMTPARQLLAKRGGNTAIGNLLTYLQGKIKQKAGIQKLDNEAAE